MNRPLRTKTIDTNPTYLTSDETYVRTNRNQIVILPKQSVSVTINVTARDTLGNTNYWVIISTFKRVNDVITIPTEPIFVTITEDKPTWSIDLEVDETNLAGSIVFTGDANVDVVANIQTNEITY